MEERKQFSKKDQAGVLLSKSNLDEMDGEAAFAKRLKWKKLK